MLGTEQEGPKEKIGCIKPCCHLDLFLPFPRDRSLDLCPSASQLSQNAAADMFSHPAGQAEGQCEPTQWP